MNVRLAATWKCFVPGHYPCSLAVFVRCYYCLARADTIPFPLPTRLEAPPLSISNSGNRKPLSGVFGVRPQLYRSRFTGVAMTTPMIDIFTASTAVRPLRMFATVGAATLTRPLSDSGTKQPHVAFGGC